MAAIVLRGDARALPLPDASVDLICTSPPYFGLRSYTDAGEHYDGQIGSEATPREWLAVLLDCTREWVRVLKPSGSIFVNLGDSFSSGQRYDNEFTIEDGAWLGGVIDSDGSISIHKQGTSYTAWMRVGQMRPEVVHRIRDVTGVGQVFQDKRGVWNWNAAAQQASAVLARIWPWLHIKRRQAFAAVELQGRKAAVGGRGRWNALTDDELRHRERIRQAVLAWNAGDADDYEPPLLPLPDLPARARWIPPKSLMGLPWRYAFAVQDELGLILRRDIVWQKVNGLPESVTDRCRSSHEYVFHLVKQPRYFSAVDEIREPHSGTAHPQKREPAGSASGNGVRHRTFAGQTEVFNPLGKLPGSVWDIPSQPLTVPGWLDVDHFAAFPVELPRRIILGWSPSGICTECGEGRRPVADRSEKALHRPSGAARIGTRMAAVSHNERERSNCGNVRTVHRITGYACACPDAAASTRPGVVLDPFGGTGTTSLVAAAYGRTGVTVDRSADYCRLARWRTTDPAERARALRVAKPPPVPDGQDSLFGLEAL